MTEKIPVQSLQSERDPSYVPPVDKIAEKIKSLADPIDNLLNRPDAQDDPDIAYIKSLGGFRLWLQGQAVSYKKLKVDQYWASVQIWKKANLILNRYR